MQLGLTIFQAKMNLLALLLLMLLVLSALSQVVKYVRPDDSAPEVCPDQPCFTLRHYVQQVNTSFTSAANFLFLPGNHSLQAPLKIDNTTNVTLQQNYENKEVTIACSRSGFIEVNGVANFEVKGLNFELYIPGETQVSSGLLVTNSRDVLVTNSTFRGNEFSVHITVTDSEHVVIEDCTVFDGNAVAAIASDVTIAGSKFQIQKKYQRFSSTLMLLSAIVKITGSQFDSKSGYSVRGVNATGCNLKIKQCKFFENTAGENSFGGAIITQSNSTTEIVGCLFERNTAISGGAIAAIDNSHITVSGTVFVRNQATLGGAILAMSNSTIDIVGSHFERNTATSIGGAAYANINSHITVSGTVFVRNQATYAGGTIISLSNSTIEIVDCCFEKSIAKFGGAIYASGNSHITASGTILVRNQANQGGAVFIYQNSTLILRENLGGNVLHNVATKQEGIYNSSFLHISSNNEESDLCSQSYGDALQSCHTIFSGKNAYKYDGDLHNNSCSYFIGNVAKYAGGAGYIENGRLSIAECIHFFLNKADLAGGALTVINSNFEISAKVSFESNLASSGGAIFNQNASFSAILHESKALKFENNSSPEGGSAIFCFSATLKMKNATLLNNTGIAITLNNCTLILSSAHFDNNFDCILAETSALKLHETAFLGNSHIAIFIKDNTELVITNTTMTKNKGRGITVVAATVLIVDALFESNEADDGGAIAVYNGKAETRGIVTFKNNKAKTGGAISIFNAEIIFKDIVIFTSNSAENSGGAMYFNSGSTLTLEPHTNITAEHNHASKFGGIIYREDTAIIKQCEFETRKESALSDGWSYVLPRCFINLKKAASDSRLYTVNSYNNTAGEGNFLYGGLLGKCWIPFKHFLVPGIPFNIALVPYSFLAIKVFHINSQASNTSIVHDISSKPYQLCFCENDNAYNCSSKLLMQTISGLPFNVSLLAKAQGGSTVTSTVTALSSTARFKPGQTAQMVGPHCTTLTYTLYSKRDEEQLVLYPDGPCHDTGLSKAAINLTLLPCPDAFMLSGDQCICEERLRVYDVECFLEENIYIKVNAGAHFWMSMFYDNGSYKGLILFSTCPADYCTKNAVNLTMDDLDAQCEKNRKGLLCGVCAANYSLLLGSTQCQKCSNSYLFLLLAFAVSGIALVVFLSFLRLTVAAGMINSMLLYANIIQANKNSLLFDTSRNALTVFIAWLNLDLGLQTCFYNGMDAYAQTWLQFAFPLYIWILISLIIITSRYSINMSKLIGHNPIAVLATLLLMSYAKVLKIIIEVFSSVDLEYPGNKTVTVWLKDANVPYLHSKHLVLTVTSTLFLVFLFLPYTFLVLLGHKLYRFSGNKYFHWLRRVKPLLDSYHAPYKIKTRFWTGLLLIVRCALYIVFSFNSLGGTSKSLVLITVTFTAAIILAWFVVRIYEKFYNNVIEASVYLNLITLSVASLAGVNTPELAYSLVGIVFITMLGIIAYHFHLNYTAKSLLWRKCKAKLQGSVLAASRRTSALQASPPAATSLQDLNTNVTKTVVDIPI